MKIIKKNQVVVFVIALMLVTAGYLSYKPKESENSIIVSTTLDNTTLADIGDATLVSSNSLIENAVSSNIVEETNTNNVETNNTQETSNNTTDEYFTNSKMQRDTMYSQMIESYQKILENSNISEEQKSISSKEINEINQTKNAIMITENLIKTKGFEDVVIFVNSDSISVIIKKDKLETTDIAQIQNIVTRELKAQIEDIHISNK